MASRSPPPLHTPDPASPFHVLKAQWGILHHYLYNQPPFAAHSAARIWLDNIDRKVLMTASAKKRAEIDILRSEADHAESNATRYPKIDIELPNYEVGTPPFTPPPTLSPKSPPSPAVTLPLDIYSASTKVGHASMEHTDRLSPLSPSFGHRRFDLFSGPVSRRRSLPPGSSPTSSYSSTTGISKTANGNESLLKDWEKRLRWEAAWREIERNLDGYVDRFAEGGDGKAGVWGDVEDIWEELVDLKVEGELLEERIRNAREHARV